MELKNPVIDEHEPSCSSNDPNHLTPGLSEPLSSASNNPNSAAHAAYGDSLSVSGKSRSGLRSPRPSIPGSPVSQSDRRSYTPLHRSHMYNRMKYYSRLNPTHTHHLVPPAAVVEKAYSLRTYMFTGVFTTEVPEYDKYPLHIDASCSCRGHYFFVFRAGR